MRKSRRSFLKAGAVAAFTAGVSTQFNKVAFGQRPEIRPPEPVGEFEPPVQSQADILNYLTRSSFESHVNSIFEVPVKRGMFSRSVPLTLVSATGVSRWFKSLKSSKSISAEVADEQCFSLLFRGELKTPLIQDVYDVRHPALGTLHVLLAPTVHRDRSALYYEVAFGHMRLPQNS